MMLMKPLMCSNKQQEDSDFVFDVISSILYLELPKPECVIGHKNSLVV